MRQPGVDVVQVKQMLSTFGHRGSFAAEDQAEIKSTLLHLHVDNLSNNKKKLSRP